MRYLDDFPTEEEFQTFRTWAIEGSTIGQRMTVGDNPREIPAAWEGWKPIAQKMVNDFPSTLEDFQRWVDDGIKRLAETDNTAT